MCTVVYVAFRLSDGALKELGLVKNIRSIIARVQIVTILWRRFENSDTQNLNSVKLKSIILGVHFH
jgi:hypothetical protein